MLSKRLQITRTVLYAAVDVRRPSFPGRRLSILERSATPRHVCTVTPCSAVVWRLLFGRSFPWLYCCVREVALIIMDTLIVVLLTYLHTFTKLTNWPIPIHCTGTATCCVNYSMLVVLFTKQLIAFTILLISIFLLTVFFWLAKMVELSDPKGPYQEGISNSIFIIPGIIIVVLVGM